VRDPRKRERERERARKERGSQKQRFFYWRNFRQKEKLKITKRSEFEGFQSPEVREKEQKRGTIARLVIWFHYVAKNVEG
jgi:hypothetical protein